MANTEESVCVSGVRDGGEPIVSVVVPVYGVERFLGEALGSLRRQTLARWEAVCVDDGGVDRCGALLDEAVRGDARVRVVHQRNARVCGARNRGMAYARGVYLAFLDPDDGFAPNWLAHLVEVAERTGADMVEGRLRFVEEGANLGVLSASGEAPESRSVEDLLEVARIWWSAYLISSACNRLWRRSALEGQWFDVASPFGEDTLFVWEAFARVRRLAVLKESGYYYRLRGDSSIHSRHIGNSIAGWTLRCSCVWRLTWKLRVSGEARWLCPALGLTTHMGRLVVYFLHRRHKAITFAPGRALEAWLAAVRRGEQCGLAWRFCPRLFFLGVLSGVLWGAYGCVLAYRRLAR